MKFVDNLCLIISIILQQFVIQFDVLQISAIEHISSML